MAEMTDMRKDVDWYYANLDSLLPIYNGKYLAIADGQLLGDFDECIDGVRAMESAGRKRGTYIVHKCIPLEQERREWYYRSNRVRFRTRTRPKSTEHYIGANDFVLIFDIPAGIHPPGWSPHR